MDREYLRKKEMCYPFTYCALCKSNIVPFQGVFLQAGQNECISFCDDRCRSEYIFRTNRSLTLKPNERPPRPLKMATGRYAQEEYHAF